MALVTISMPVHLTPLDLLNRAVAAVRAQTFPDWQLVLIGDGCTIEPRWHDDPRITVVELPENRGRYYCDAVAFAATDSPWFAVHDSDDAARPEWLEKLIELAYRDGADVALSAQTVHRLNRQTATERVAPFDRGRVALTHHSHMAGVWRRSWLAEIGGPHPGFRVGFDTLLTSLPYIAGRLVTTSQPLYDRYKRVRSLTTAPATGMRSEYRAKVRSDLEGLYAKILAGCVSADHVGSNLAGRRYLIREVLATYPDPTAYDELAALVATDAAAIRYMRERIAPAVEALGVKP